MSVQDCPKCGKRALSWDARSNCWLCHMSAPACSFSESEREHTLRLRALNTKVITGAAAPEPLFVRCRVCAGSLRVPGGDAPGLDWLVCPCVRTPTPGFEPLPAGEVSQYPGLIQLDRDRLLVALWEIATCGDGSEAAYHASSLLGGRDTSVFVARRNLQLPEIPVEQLVVTNRVGRSEALPPEGLVRVLEDLRLRHADVLAKYQACRVSEEIEATECETVATQRDTAEAALAEAHRALGGDGDWTTRMGGKVPDSGDLRRDVPALAALVRADRDRLLVALWDGLTRSFDMGTRAARLVDGRGGEVEALKRSASPSHTLFSHLIVGEHFVLVPEPGAPNATLPLLVRTADTPRTGPGLLPYNTCEHDQGMMCRTEPHAPVVRVGLAANARRYVGEPKTSGG